MKKKLLLLLFSLFITSPVFAASSGCAAISKYTKPAIQIVLIAAPILTILLCTIDMFKAVTAGDEKSMSKNYSVIIKRLIICAVIMILPIIVNFIIGFTVFDDLSACY